MYVLNCSLCCPLQELEQTNYSLKLSLERKDNMERTYEEEMESLKRALQQQKEAHSQFLENEHGSKISQLRKEVTIATQQ